MFDWLIFHKIKLYESSGTIQRNYTLQKQISNDHIWLTFFKYIVNQIITHEQALHIAMRLDGDCWLDYTDFKSRNI